MLLQKMRMLRARWQRYRVSQDQIYETGARRGTVYNAAFDGRAATVRRLIDRGADVHWKEANGATPLHVASQNGHNATVKTLLAANAQVDAKRVSAHRAPSLERVPAAPLPSRLSLPRRAPPSPLAPPAADGFPLSWGLSRSAGWRMDPSPHRLTERTQGGRQDAPRRQRASGRQAG